MLKRLSILCCCLISLGAMAQQRPAVARDSSLIQFSGLLLSSDSIFPVPFAFIHAKGKPLDKDLTWEKIAKRTVGFSGADLENMLNEAAIGAARNNKDKIDMKDIDDAWDLWPPSPSSQ